MSYLFRQVTANNEELTESPFTQELAMEAYLMENPAILALDSDNFAESEVLDAEVALTSGTRQGDGRIDLFVKYGGEYLAIAELKKEEITEDTITQLEGYLDQKHQLLNMDKNYWDEDYEPKWAGIVIGTSISADLQRKLEEGYTTPNGIPIAGIVMRRFKTQKELFVISDTYFKFAYTNKDYSKFRFQKKPYNKARLVNAVIQQYVQDNPEVTFEQLKNVFPDSLQTIHGVFTHLSDAVEVYERTGHKRYYIKDEETMTLGDGKPIATCNQWGVNNIEEFIETAQKYGYQITQA